MNDKKPSWGTPEWHRLHPIYGTDFSKSPHVLVEDVRMSLSQLRGQLGDIGHGYRGWKEQIEEVTGLLTCGIRCLHDVMTEMEKALSPRTPPPDPGATPLQRDGDDRPESLAKTGSEPARDAKGGGER